VNKDQGEGAKQLSWDKIATGTLNAVPKFTGFSASGSLKTAEDFHDAAFTCQLHSANEGTPAPRPDPCVSELLYEDAGSVRGEKRKISDF
jgi:hypothetical protein